jgi:D-alanyl-D-alanine dipeptidase
VVEVVVVIPVVVADVPVETVVNASAVVELVGVVVVEPDVVDELQDAKTMDITMRQVSAIQIIPLFIQASFNI